MSVGAETAARVDVVRARADRLPERLASVARDWVADRRLGPQDLVAVQVGLAADTATVDAMRRAAQGTLDPVGVRLRRWLDERTDHDAVGLRAAVLHADFMAWTCRSGEPSMGLAAFARRLRGLGIEGRLHPRNRGSEFRLALRSPSDVTDEGQLATIARDATPPRVIDDE